MLDNKWVASGEEVADLRVANLYVSDEIRGFLEHDRQTWLISSKGMGKTHLLRLKRLAYDEERAEFTLVPAESSTGIDRMTSLPETLPAKRIEQLEDEGHWQALWEVAIGLSVLLHHPLAVDSAAALGRLASSDNVPDLVREAFEDKLEKRPFDLLPPCYIVQELLIHRQGQLFKLLNERHRLVVRPFQKFVRSAAAVFIDSIDQAIESAVPGNTHIWRAGQIGLLRAAFEMNRSNPHVRIYTAIRQEAWASFVNPNKNVISSQSVILRYTKRELKSLLNKLTYYYEGMDDISSFLGVNDVHNRSLQLHEPIFDYIYRHSLGTPRSLIRIAHDLSVRASSTRSQTMPLNDLIVEVVDRAAASFTGDRLAGEISKFLPVLNNEPSIREALGQLKFNILSKSQLERASERVIAALQLPEDSSPYADLFNVGLLGCLRSNAMGERMIHFQRPTQFEWQTSATIPESDYYFVHPGLLAATSEWGIELRVSQAAVVGDRLPWASGAAQEIATRRKRFFVSYAHDDDKLADRLTSALGHALDERFVEYELWRDKWMIRDGDWIQQRISDGLDAADLMLLIVTRRSLSSAWVQLEWTTKFSEEIERRQVSVVPIIVGAARHDELPTFLRQRFVRRVSAQASAEQLELVSESIRELIERQHESAAA